MGATGGCNLGVTRSGLLSENQEGLAARVCDGKMAQTRESVGFGVYLWTQGPRLAVGLFR